LKNITNHLAEHATWSLMVENNKDESLRGDDIAARAGPVDQLQGFYQ
jgi:hypothetical protein